MSEADTQQAGAAEQVWLRNEFYRDNYRRMMVFCLLLIAILVGLVSFAYFMYTTRPEPRYFATTPDGKLIDMVALDTPNLQTNTLLQWATQAATSAYTFNFVDYKESLQKTSDYFTTQGYEHFLEALKVSNNLEAVRAKKLVVSAVPTGTPVILKKGVTRSGRFAWQIQMPMLISYQSANDLLKQDITVTMLVIRVPTLESADGVGIAQFVVEEGRG